jgi:rhodanese-related sulfurtransferase
METAILTQIIPEISTDTLAALMRSRLPIHLLDARPARTGQGRIWGARHLAPDTPEDAIQSLLPDKGEFIVTYCGGPACGASERLAERLRSLGYTNVVRYRLGYEGWTEADLPVEIA